MINVKIKILPDFSDVSFSSDSIESIEDVTKLINETKNSNDDYEIINGGKKCSYEDICDISKSNESTFYAIKKSIRPLKRKLENEDLENLMIKGVGYKKLCIDDSVFKQPSLKDLNRAINNVVESNPLTMENIISQPQVNLLMENAPVISKLIDAVPKLSDENPTNYKIFKDVSQYKWLQDSVINFAGNLNACFDDYSLNKNEVVESERVKKLNNYFNKLADSSKLNKKEFNFFPNFLNNQYSAEMLDMICENKNYADSMLKLCPYGSALSSDELTDIQSMLPEIRKKYRDAASSGRDVLKYLQEHPIEFEDNDLLERLVNATSRDSSGLDEKDDSCVTDLMVDTIDYLCKKEGLAGCKEEGMIEIGKTKYTKEIDQLQQMGFMDNDKNSIEQICKVLVSEMGSVERSAIRLLQ